jgi:hypothetical protein
MNQEVGILAVGEELPPLDASPEVPCQPAVRGPRRRRPKPSTGQAPGRFQTLNAFVDGTLRGLSRSEMAAWLVLYRDCRDGTARTSLADMARRGGMDVRTAARAIRRLRKRGLVEVVRTGGLNRGPSTYRLNSVPKAG